MKEKINIAQLLKDCPTGMELDCTLYENVEFDYIEQSPELAYPIHCITKTNGGYNALVFTHNGCNDRHPNAKCVIFPKGKTTWEGFHRPFKDGDILFYKHKSNNIKYIFIYKRRVNMHYLLQYCGWFSEKPYLSEQFNAKERIPLYENDDIRFATEEEKAKLFKAIKDNGYRWDTKNKTLEKLPMFKVGDKIKLKGGDEFGIITEVADCFFTIQCKNNTHYWSIKKQDDWELINKPNFKVGDKIKKKGLDIANPIEITAVTPEMYTFRDGSFQYVEIIDKNYVLVPNKFDINTLVPFESRVLIRDSKSQKWSPAIWGFYDSDSQDYRYKLVGIIARYCIPYEGNEHLLGTTDDCDEYFKLIS